MTTPPELSIPHTQTSTTTPPYTIYNISIRLPLRSYILQKRYSDFLALHKLLTTQSTNNTSPPFPLPSKSWFSRTISNPTLTEARRKGLETYLRKVNEARDQRWRNTDAWRRFLNLPIAATTTTGGMGEGTTAALQARLVADATATLSDPTVWLDTHRELKGMLRDARAWLTRRDQATTALEQRDAAAQAKRFLVKASTAIAKLDKGLKGGAGDEDWGTERLGEGEKLRRKDLVASARVERDGLEALLVAVAAKSNGAENGAAMATKQDKAVLIGNGSARSGRVLGAPAKETERTRERDNEGVLQLQKQMMEEQDLDVDALRKIVARQKELGIAINEEINEQNALLKMTDEDVDRLEGKIGVAKKRIGKIS
ncbi:MAG: hypothetical protein M1812_004549 [Candelaria pacifica]|nr:MAG: hypothetical protein M1812_004549 [Candelaria pacifica]